MARAISVTELITKRRKIMTFSGDWQDALGSPELRGSWIVWGESGNGKTNFVLQLCKYLANFERVAYNSLEEGDSQTMSQGFIDVGMEQVKNRVILLDGESIEELSKRLEKHKSPNIIVIDSVQYSGITYPEYRNLKSKFPGKLFIWISHAEGKQPDGKSAKKIRFDSNIKIRVEGYRAFTTSRYGATVPYYTIWKEGAARYWGIE